ncbi:MAG: EF-hand domain-containing protein, partial [Pedosphaera parvula]|nr:EF-hand domain-containing protein [Pedosphaera parvula]
MASRIKAPSAEDFAAKLIAEKDTDGDGALSVSEASAGNRGLPEDLFGKIDADGDGLLTQDEIVAGRPEGPPPRLQELNGSAYGLTQRFSVEDAVSQLIAEKDSDGDGALSVEEAAAGDRGLPGELIAALDTDGDGILSEEELIAGAPQGPPPGAPP